MRYFKHFLVVIAILAIGVILTYFINNGNINIIWSITGMMLFYQIICFANRGNLNWKSFYTSPLNILTAKKIDSFEFDIEDDLLFAKAIEILKSNGFKIKKVDEEKKVILTTTAFSMKSWGENVYVSILKIDENTSKLIYETVAFQVYTWGKNEDNATDFKMQLEESFII